MFAESEYKSRINTAETNSLKLYANICGDFVCSFFTLLVLGMEQGHSFDIQYQDEGNQCKSQKDRTAVERDCSLGWWYIVR